MRIPISLAILAIAPASLAAQDLDPKAEWMQFSRQEGAAWHANWSSATGTPTVYGGRLKVAAELATVAAARPHAVAVLNRHASMLGRGASKFNETRATSVRHLHYFIYNQTFRGLEVRGGRADVRLTKSGEVVMFGSNAVRIPNDFSIRPKVTAARARQLAEQAILGQAGKPGRKTRLVIHSQPFGQAATVPTLAWEVSINETPTELIAGRVYIDALTGAQLEFENGIYSCTTCGKTRTRGGHAREIDDRLHRGLAARTRIADSRGTKPAGNTATKMTISGTVMGWTNTGHSPLDPLVNVPMKNMFVSSSAGNTTTDANGQFSIPYNGTANVTVSVTMAGEHLSAMTPSTGTALTASASLMPNVPGTVQIGTSTMPATDWSQTTTYYFTDDVNEYVRGLVPNQPTAMARLDQITATVNLSSSCNAFYGGNNMTYMNESATCNMTAYEGVIYHEWGHGLDDAFGGINRTDGLSEGWADVVAILRSQQPILGPDFFKNQTPNYVRIATNSRTYPAGGGTHQMGEVWMGWVWDVRTDLESTLGTVLAQQITESIVIPTIVANAPDLERQILEVFLLDDNDNDLRNGTPHYFELERACIKRNIDYPPLATGILTHLPLRTSADQLTARATVLDAMPISGSFSSAELIYDAGSGDVRVAMVPTGNANEWIALIPGVLSPNIVSYYFEATHSTTKLLRLPEAGSYEYRIGQEEIFLFEDFESPNAGWTSGGFGSQFSRGAPSGATGTSWNIQWSVPNQAFSGTNCWGLNLSGAYAPHTDSYLRTPILDLTGKTNVRLRFQRWLQVQESKYDFARIGLNNDLVWENDWNANTIDTGWTKFDVGLPTASNNPSVQLEWSLLADGGLELAGWQIDDVTIYTFDALPPPPLALEFDPAMVDLGQQSTVTIEGTPSAPILILVGATAGPIMIPGLPTIHVGPGFSTLAANLDANGKLTFNFTAPTSQSATGQQVFVQVLERTNSNTITGSNPGVILWGK